MVLMSCVCVFADNSNARDLTAPNGNKFLYKIEYENNSSSLVMYCNKYSFDYNKSQLSIDGRYALYYSNGSLIGSSNSSVSNFIFDFSKINKVINSDGSLVPPEIAPTIAEAIAKILPDFLVQFKKLLPIGVTLFAMLLGTRLVPRLIRLFQ